MSPSCLIKYDNWFLGRAGYECNESLRYLIFPMANLRIMVVNASSFLFFLAAVSSDIGYEWFWLVNSDRSMTTRAERSRRQPVTDGGCDWFSEWEWSMKCFSDRERAPMERWFEHLLMRKGCSWFQMWKKTTNQMQN